MPPFRTADYAIWRACERIGIRPPDVRPSWDECDVWAQAYIIAYSQVREYEEQEQKNEELKVIVGARV